MSFYDLSVSLWIRYSFKQFSGHQSETCTNSDRFLSTPLERANRFTTDSPTQTQLGPSCSFLPHCFYVGPTCYARHRAFLFGCSTVHSQQLTACFLKHTSVLNRLGNIGVDSHFTADRCAQIISQYSHCKNSVEKSLRTHVTLDLCLRMYVHMYNNMWV